ncbi:hypothetical protein TIFTF001_016751 [Ficus carica]|uniref:Uncharacterized protein n=1 Tax=Ficus carica TaxID=3494 RepID=A0AA88D6G2_FICCA|nr:hypothetical protein TIFTF001_016751 [Ficus carica]
MPKIFGTTPDVVAWSDRSCTVTLRRVTCKKGKHLEVMRRPVGSATGTPMLKRSPRARAFGWPGWVDPLVFPTGRQASGAQALQPQSEQATEVGDVIGTIAGHASDVRRWIECCDRVSPPAQAEFRMRGVACPGQQHHLRILTNLGVRTLFGPDRMLSRTVRLVHADEDLLRVTEIYQELSRTADQVCLAAETEKVNTLPSSITMSDHLSDSENDNLSGDADITGSSSSIVSSSSDTTGEMAKRGARTPDHLSGILDIPSSDKPATPSNQAQKGAARLEQILQMSKATRPDQEFIEELNGATQVQPAPLVNLTADGDTAS